jgi:hypothetical protein
MASYSRRPNSSRSIAIHKISVQFPVTSQNRLLFKQDRQYTHKRNIEALSRNHFFCGKIISIACSERVFVAWLSSMQSA